MGIVAKALWLGPDWRLRAAGDLFARAAAVKSCSPRLRRSAELERAAFRVGEIDRQRGGRAGIAVRSAGAEHDHGGCQRDGHDVSQENG